MNSTFILPGTRKVILQKKSGGFAVDIHELPLSKRSIIALASRYPLY
jgi:hypothetical protein